MAWVSAVALSVTAEIRSEHSPATLALATLALAMLVRATLALHTAEAVSLMAPAHYRWPEPFRVPLSYRIRHSRSWAVEFRMLAASVFLGRTAAGILAAGILGHSAHPDTTTPVYRTRVTQWAAASVFPARQRQER